jgi:hypothetical protein
VTAFRPPPERHWRSYGTEPLPTPQEALRKPLSAFPSWFLRVECERCSKVRTFNEAHLSGARRRQPLQALLAKMRHDGCGGQPGRVELMSGVDGVSSRPVRRIVLRAG